MQRARQRGFTLIEVLVVTVIVAVISLAVFSTLNSGLRVWHRVHGASSDDDLAIFFLRFGSDVRSAFSYGNQTLSGTMERVEIPSVDIPAPEGNHPGAVVFGYNATTRAACRWFKTRGQVEEGADGSVASCVRGVERVQVSYYANDTSGEGLSWFDAWQRQELPLAVRIEVQRSSSGNNQTYSKTAFIPVAVYPHEKKTE